MKNVILTATIIAIAVSQNTTMAGGCSNSGGGHWGAPAPIHHVERPVWRPAQPVHHVERPIWRPVHPVPVVERKTCTIHGLPQHHEVAPAPTPVTPGQLPQLECGQTVTIDGRLFGSQPGSVTVEISGLVMNTNVVGWTSNQAKAVLPVLPLSGPVQATVVVRSAYNKVAAQLDIELLPAQTPGTPSQEVPAVPQPELPVVSPGQDVTLDAANLGTIPGLVQISVGGLKLNATVSNWSNAQVTATLPALQIANAVQARVEIITPNGQVATHVDVMFTPTAVGQVAGR